MSQWWFGLAALGLASMSLWAVAEVVARRRRSRAFFIASAHLALWFLNPYKGGSRDRD